MHCPSLSLITFFILRTVLSDMRIATPASFCFLFVRKTFFHPFTFSLYVSFGLKWVSYRQYIYGSCFSIHSASLCLLVGDDVFLFVCFLMSFWIKSVLIIDLYLVFPQPRNCIHQWQCTLSAYIDNCILLNKKIEKWSNSLITDKDRWTYLPSTQRLSLSPGLVQFHPWVLVGSYRDTKQTPGHRWGCSPITQCLVCLFDWWGHWVECMHEGG